MRCGQQDVVRWESTYRQLEHEANTFAAYLLMPLDDYRRQIDSSSAVDLDAIAHCADRYEVSLIAATLRWLEYTERRSVLVVSRDEFILWARSKQGRTQNRGRSSVLHRAQFRYLKDRWLRANQLLQCREMALSYRLEFGLRNRVRR